MNKENIGILMPMTSKGQKWIELSDCCFIKTFLPSFIKTAEFTKYNYVFYIGIDANDEFFSKYINKLKLRLNNESKILIQPNKLNGNPCMIWNNLFKEAYYDNIDYFYQVGDDIKILSNNWSSYFINILKKNNNIGVIGGVELSYWNERLVKNTIGIIENGFVSRKHYEIFKTFFNIKLKTWCSDDWLSNVYNHMCFTAPNIEFINTNRVGGHNPLSRYEPNMNDRELYLRILPNDKKILNNYLTRLKK